MTLATPPAVQQKIEAKLQALHADVSVAGQAKMSQVVIQDIASETTSLSEEESTEQFVSSVNGGTSVKLVEKTRRLVLAFQVLEDESAMVCAALQAYEFNCYSSAEDKAPCLRIVYLTKVDTTGLVEPRSLQRPLVHAMVHGYLEAQSSLASCQVRIHVLSTSNPEYLFPCSQKLPGKRSLDGKRLMYWWKQVLTEVEGQRYWWVPGLEYGLLPREHRQDCRDGSQGGPSSMSNTTTTSAWTWGYPYDQDASAMSVVPMFPDDAKSACLKRAVHDKSVSVKSFFQGVLENASEFHKNDVGIFVICVAGQQDPGKDGLLENDLRAENDAPVTSDVPQDTPSQECLTQLEKCLNLVDSAEKKCTFATVEEAKKSSRFIRDLLMKRGHAWNLVEVRAPPPVTADQEGSSKKRELASVETPAIVNVLTVKRKKKN